jgi:hypothetical protein
VLCRPEDYDKAKGKYIVTTDTLAQMKKDAIVMHPLPRVDEVGGGAVAALLHLPGGRLTAVPGCSSPASGPPPRAVT